MNPSLKEIEKAVCETFQVPSWDLHSVKNPRRITIPRQAVFYLARELTRFSLPQISRWFGRHHATVIHGVRATERRLARPGPAAELIAQARARVIAAHTATGWDISSWLPFAAPAYANIPNPNCKCGRGPKEGQAHCCTACARERAQAAVRAAQEEKRIRRRRLVAFAQAHASSSVRP